MFYLVERWKDRIPWIYRSGYRPKCKCEVCRVVRLLRKQGFIRDVAV